MAINVLRCITQLSIWNFLKKLTAFSSFSKMIHYSLCFYAFLSSTCAATIAIYLNGPEEFQANYGFGKTLIKKKYLITFALSLGLLTIIGWAVDAILRNIHFKRKENVSLSEVRIVGKAKTVAKRKSSNLSQTSKSSRNVVQKSSSRRPMLGYIKTDSGMVRSNDSSSMPNLSPTQSQRQKEQMDSYRIRTNDIFTNDIITSSSEPMPGRPESITQDKKFDETKVEDYYVKKHPFHKANRLTVVDPAHIKMGKQEKTEETPVEKELVEIDAKDVSSVQKEKEKPIKEQENIVSRMSSIRKGKEIVNLNITTEQPKRKQGSFEETPKQKDRLGESVETQNMLKEIISDQPEEQEVNEKEVVIVKGESVETQNKKNEIISNQIKEQEINEKGIDDVEEKVDDVHQDVYFPDSTDITEIIEVASLKDETDQKVTPGEKKSSKPERRKIPKGFRIARPIGILLRKLKKMSKSTEKPEVEPKDEEDVNEETPLLEIDATEKTSVKSENSLAGVAENDLPLEIINRYSIKYGLKEYRSISNRAILSGVESGCGCYEESQVADNVEKPQHVCKDLIFPPKTVQKIVKRIMRMTLKRFEPKDIENPKKKRKVLQKVIAACQKDEFKNYIVNSVLDNAVSNIDETKNLDQSDCACGSLYQLCCYIFRDNIDIDHGLDLNKHPVSDEVIKTCLRSAVEHVASEAVGVIFGKKNRAKSTRVLIPLDGESAAESGMAQNWKSITSSRRENKV